MISHAPTDHPPREQIDDGGQEQPTLGGGDVGDVAPEAAAMLRKAAPGIKIIVMTAFGDHPSLEAAIEAGVEGCVLKDVKVTDLVGVIRRVVSGGGATIGDSPAAPAPGSARTRR